MNESVYKQLWSVVLPKEISEFFELVKVDVEPGIEGTLHMYGYGADNGPIAGRSFFRSESGAKPLLFLKIAERNPLSEFLSMSHFPDSNRG